MTEKETVTINKDEYNEMLEQLRWLQCLENAGVDNWEGCEMAQEMYNE